jgi:hypothetical protein
MATSTKSKPNPFASGKFKPFEKSKGDKEAPRFGKEGSKKEEAKDKMQGMMGFKKGGCKK